ncbi:GATA transcription factor 24-like [Telopea speciosissima]|uniref:GATA transcription factor 24-like n=1 Tax=Telopea speciosissima TaxID=54955 RepID=UPI001CC3F4D3|nr:GATA transcription factor 24-like [Telopea speciosissima]
MQMVMHLPGQIDKVHGGNPPLPVAEPQPMDMHYMQEHDHAQHHNNGNDIDDQEDGGGSEGLEGDVPSDHGNLSDPHGSRPSRVHGGNQLTLSFQGEVYVFDSVSAETVQAVLLLLGGHEVPPIVPTLVVTPPQNNANNTANRGLSDIPSRWLDAVGAGVGLVGTGIGAGVELVGAVGSDLSKAGKFMCRTITVTSSSSKKSGSSALVTP